jgi:inner membrane protein
MFWKRRMLWRGEGLGGAGAYNLLEGLNHARLEPEIVPLRLDDRRLPAAARRDPHVRAFLFWSRMPMVVIDGRRAFLTDQRFYENSRRVRATPFLIPLDIPPPSS